MLSKFSPSHLLQIQYIQCSGGLIELLANCSGPCKITSDSWYIFGAERQNKNNYVALYVFYNKEAHKHHVQAL
jgi:hypothetical protein